MLLRIARSSKYGTIATTAEATAMALAGGGILGSAGICGSSFPPRRVCASAHGSLEVDLARGERRQDERGPDTARQSKSGGSRGHMDCLWLEGHTDPVDVLPVLPDGRLPSGFRLSRNQLVAVIAERALGDLLDHVLLHTSMAPSMTESETPGGLKWGADWQRGVKNVLPLMSRS